MGSKFAVFFGMHPAVSIAAPAISVAALAVCAVAAVSASVAAQEQAEDNTMFWSTTLKMIRAKFPGVAQVSTDTLESWLDEPGQAERPLLLDVREPEEYEVSHLEGAVAAPSRAAALEALEGSSPDRPVVLYCSVGYRSSEVADYLAKQGFRKVYNLEGSIFAWANEGRSVYRGGERVHVVHPYDGVWGKLLNKALRAG